MMKILPMLIIIWVFCQEMKVLLIFLFTTFYFTMFFFKKKGDMNEAIACYIKSLSIDPRNVNANHNLLVKK